MRAIVIAAVLLLTASGLRAAETRLADPKPDWDNPRKVVVQMTSDDPARVNGIFYNAVNIQKFYGADNVKVAIIAYGAGVRALLKDGAANAERTASLQDYGIEFVACGATLETIGKGEADLLPGVAVTAWGIPEILERQKKGWQYIAP